MGNAGTKELIASLDPLSDGLTQEQAERVIATFNKQGEELGPAELHRFLEKYWKYNTSKDVDPTQKEKVMAAWVEKLTKYSKDTNNVGVTELTRQWSEQSVVHQYSEHIETPNVHPELMYSHDMATETRIREGGDEDEEKMEDVDDEEEREQQEIKNLRENQRKRYSSGADTIDGDEAMFAHDEAVAEVAPDIVPEIVLEKTIVLQRRRRRFVEKRKQKEQELELEKRKQKELRDAMWERVAQMAPKASVKQPSIPGRWRTVRVFISSTFVDMHGERDVLIKEVFPEVNLRLKRHFVRVVPVDLRWGVSAEQTHSIQSTCLDEIDRCRMTTDELPWFIGLRGKRHGWVQDEYQKPNTFAFQEYFSWLSEYYKREKKLSITSMEVYHAFVGAHATVAAKTRVKNIPHSIFLFRKPDFMADVEDDRKWLFDFESLPVESKETVPEALRNQYAFRSTELCNEYQKDYHDLDAAIKNSTIPVYNFDYPCTYDKSKITGKLPNGKMFGVGWVGGLEEFKNFTIRSLSDSLMAEYPPFIGLTKEIMETAKHRSLVEDRAEGFVGRGELLHQLLSYRESSPEHPFVMEAKEEEAVTEWACGVCTVLNPIEATECSVCGSPAPTPEPAPEWACAVCTCLDPAVSSECGVCGSPAPPPEVKPQDPAEGNALCLVGTPGCGKSALVARFAQMVLAEESGEASPVIVLHLVGASEDSASLRKLLTRICTEIKQAFPDITDAVPSEIDALKSEWHSVFLAKASQSRRVVLVLDALNQLLAGDDAHEMSWFPPKLPANSRVIVSTLEHENGVFANLQNVHAGLVIEWIKPLLLEERETLVSTLLLRYHKLLTTDDSNTFLGNQMEKLMQKEAADSPLYLVLAADALRRFGIYEKLTSYITRLPGTIPSLFQRTLSDLEEDHGLDLVRSALSLIAISRSGLLEVEIMQLLELKDQLGLKETKSNFSLLSGQIQGFFAAGGSGFLQFFHSQVAYIVCDRYGLSRVGQDEAKVNREFEARMHQVLGGYFETLVRERLEGKVHQNDEHATKEVIFHLCKANHDSRARALLMNMNYCFLKLEFFSVDDLLDDFDFYLSMNQNRYVKLVRQAVEMSRMVLTLDPSQLSLQLFARLQEAARESADVAGLIEPTNWVIARHPSQLLPRVWSGLHKPGGPLIATLNCGKRAEITDVSEPFELAFPGKEKQTVCLVTTDDDVMIMWDLTKRTVVHTYKGGFHSTPKRLTFVPGSSMCHVVATGYSKTMSIFSLTSKDNTANHAVFQVPGKSSATIVSEQLIDIKDKGVHLVTACSDGGLYVWDVNQALDFKKGKLHPVHVLQGHTTAVSFLSCSSSSNLPRNSSEPTWNWTAETEAPSVGDGRVISWDHEGFIRCFDLASATDKMVECVHTVTAHRTIPGVDISKRIVISGALSYQDGKRLLSWDQFGVLVDTNLTNMDDKTNSTIFQHEGKRIAGVLLLDDDHALSWTSKLIVWDLRNPDPATNHAFFTGHDQARNVKNARLVPGTNGQLILSSSSDRTLKLWRWKDCKAGEDNSACLLTLNGHVEAPRFTFLAGMRAISWSDSVRVWDLQAKSDEEACLQVFSGQDGGFSGVRVIEEGKKLFTWGFGGYILLWDLKLDDEDEGEGDLQIPCHAEDVVGMCQIGLDKKVSRTVTAGKEGSVYVWEVECGRNGFRCEVHETKHAAAITELKPLTESKYITVSDDWSATVWAGNQQERVLRFPIPADADLSARRSQFSNPSVYVGNDAKILLGKGFCQDLTMWDLTSDSQSPAVIFPAIEGEMFGMKVASVRGCCDFVPGESVLMWGLGSLKVMKHDGNELAQLLCAGLNVEGATVLPDQRTVAFGDKMGQKAQLLLFDTRSDKLNDNADARAILEPVQTLDTAHDVAGCLSLDKGRGGGGGGGGEEEGGGGWVICWTKGATQGTQSDLIMWNTLTTKPETNHYFLPAHQIGKPGLESINVGVVGVCLLKEDRAASWGADGNIFIWDISDPANSKDPQARCIAKLEGHPCCVENMEKTTSPCGEEILISWSKLDIRAWRLDDIQIANGKASRPTKVDSQWALFLDPSSQAACVDLTAFSAMNRIMVGCVGGGFVCFC